VLKHLREGQDASLHSLISNIKDIEFTSDYINISTQDLAKYNILTKNIEGLNKIAGGDIIRIYLNEKKSESNKTVDRLKELFGDKLKIEV